MTSLLLLLGLAAQAEDQIIHAGVFADLNLEGSDTVAPQARLGDLDFFVTAESAEGLGALAEVVLESQGSHEAFVDVERLLLRWDATDHASLTVGRVHQPLGQYITAYHHGALLQTAACRPPAVEYEHDGGLLPIHALAVELELTQTIGNSLSGLSIDLGQTDPEMAEHSDRPEAKPVGVQAQAWLMPGSSTLRLAGNAGVRWMDAERLEGLREHIFALSLSDVGLDHELWAEGFVVHYRAPDGYGTIVTGFVQGSRSFGRHQPYLRADLRWLDEQAHAYLPRATEDQIAPVLGYRLSISRHAALKLEGGPILRGDLRAPTVGGHAAAQVAVGLW